MGEIVGRLFSVIVRTAVAGTGIRCRAGCSFADKYEARPAGLGEDRVGMAVSEPSDLPSAMTGTVNVFVVSRSLNVSVPETALKSAPAVAVPDATE